MQSRSRAYLDRGRSDGGFKAAIVRTSTRRKARLRFFVRKKSEGGFVFGLRRDPYVQHFERISGGGPVLGRRAETRLWD